MDTQQLFQLYAPDPTDIHAAHSIYFQILGEQGFVGLFLFLLMWAALALSHAGKAEFTKLLAAIEKHAATGGVKLSVLDDSSIYAEGPNPDNATYTITLPAGTTSLTGLRLETIPDRRLPSKGAGRSDSDVVAYMTERYGDFVRYRPPVKMQTLVLWIGPFLLLAGGLFALLRFLQRRRQSPETNDVSQARLDEASRILSGKENRQ